MAHRIALLMSLGAFQLFDAAAEPAVRPNIVVIMADDLGASELGCYGHPSHRTPNLDRMAAEGVKFETAFACPVCHPTRFMIMTGQYGCHNGVYNFAGSRGGPPVKHEGKDDIASHVTFGQLLKSAGYATAMAGKWQLSGKPPNLIRECGFDEYCCWAFREYYPPDQLRAARAAGVDFRSRYWRPSLLRNGEWIPTTDDDYGPDHFCEFILDFIRRRRDQPFFIYYPMVLTHSPWVATPDSVKTPEDKTRRSREHFRANVEYMDKIVGSIAAALAELDPSRPNVLIFTADNGTGRGGKSEPTERGARVPLIVYGPGVVQARGSTGELTDLSDVLPTVVELAGASLPMDRLIDGKSLVPFLRGESNETRDWIFAYQADRRILRTKRWLLEDNSPRRYGRLYDCGDSRDGRGYVDATESRDPDALAARAFFAELIERLPSPVLPTDGPPNERKSGDEPLD
jgi:arylsulfatase A